jgi:hypothetical protein
MPPRSHFWMRPFLNAPSSDIQSCVSTIRGSRSLPCRQPELVPLRLRMEFAQRCGGGRLANLRDERGACAFKKYTGTGARPIRRRPAGPGTRRDCRRDRLAAIHSPSIPATSSVRSTASAFVLS